MDVKRFNITVPKKYEKDGEEKTQWNTVGTLTEFHKPDGSINRIVEIPTIGLEAQVFPFKKREDDTSNQPEPATSEDDIAY